MFSQAEVAKVDAIVEADKAWRKVLVDMEQAKKAFNANKKAVGECMKNKDLAGAEKAKAEAGSFKAAVADVEEKEKKVTITDPTICDGSRSPSLLLQQTQKEPSHDIGSCISGQG